MARLVVLMVLLLAMAGHSSAAWCVCKEGVGDPTLQKALDYACGAGADCNQIHQNGACFNPNTVKAHCNYAVNSYFQKKGQAQGSCDFSGAATVSASDPSTTGCVYPASASSVGTTTPVTPTTATPNTNTPMGGVGGSPGFTTPSSGLGGVGTGMGPSGVGINTDMSHGVPTLQKNGPFYSFLMTLLFSWFMLLWA